MNVKPNITDSGGLIILAIWSERQLMNAWDAITAVDLLVSEILT